MLRKFLSTAYVVVIESDAGTAICAYSTKGKHVNAKYLRNFTEKPAARRFLEQIVKNHYFCYVAQLFRSIGQGVLPSMDKGELVNFGIEPTNIGLLAMDDFYVYASKSEIAAAKFCAFDLLENDLLYSPFSILHTLKCKRGGTGCGLYMLKYQNQIAVMIYKDNLARFGNFFELKSQVQPADSPLESIAPELGAELDVPADEAFDELTFDDLDALDAPQDAASAERELTEASELSGSSSLENFNTEMAIFDYLKTAIREYYENPLYSSDFITELFIFEQEESSQAFLQMIKSELYLLAQVQKIDLFYEIFCHTCKDLGAKIDT